MQEAERAESGGHHDIADRITEQVERMRGRFEAIYREEYETGIRPDEVNWVAGRDPDDRTRQICNGWKADAALAVVQEAIEKRADAVYGKA